MTRSIYNEYGSNIIVVYRLQLLVGRARPDCFVSLKLSWNTWIMWVGVRRSNFMRLKFTFSWGRIHEIEFFVIFHEVEIPNNDLISWSQHFSWDRNCLIMLFRVSISWLFLWLTNQSWDQNSKKALLGNFDLMIVLVANKSIMRSKLKKSIIREFQSHDPFVSRKCDHEIKSSYAQMAN